ncbi:unnamed protein product [Rhizophagus irregularis]|nr:unnamed protein product [Rhizophagus irregularis]CAB5392986.1 unnamed protein product [Rhizophagus irregularis]
MVPSFACEDVILTFLHCEVQYIWFNKATTWPYLHQMEKDIRKSRRGLYTTNRKMIMTKKKRFRNFNIIMQKFQNAKNSHKFILENSNFYFFFISFDSFL